MYNHLRDLEGEQPQLGDLLTMVINHLLNGMILQVEYTPLKTKECPLKNDGWKTLRSF